MVACKQRIPRPLAKMESRAASRLPTSVGRDTVTTLDEHRKKHRQAVPQAMSTLTK